MKWEWSRRYSSSRGFTSFTLEEASLSQPSLSRRTASHRLARKLEKWEELVEWTDMKLLSLLTFALQKVTSVVDIVLPSLDPSL